MFSGARRSAGIRHVMPDRGGCTLDGLRTFPASAPDGGLPLFVPRVEKRYVDTSEVAHVARTRTMPFSIAVAARMRSGCEGAPRLAAVLDQMPPSQHDVLSHLQNAILKHGANCVGKPLLWFNMATGVGRGLDSEADFGQSHSADVQIGERGRVYESGHPATGFRAFELGKNVCV